MNCEWCGKEIEKTRSNRNNTKFCCRKCYLEYHAKERYNAYLQDNSIAYGLQNMQRYKKYFLQEQDHKCAICGRTDITHPDLEFRYCSKCSGAYEYCQDHLFTHTHVQ